MKTVSPPSQKILKSITFEFTDGTMHTFNPEELQAIVYTGKLIDVANNFLGVINFLANNTKPEAK